MCNGTQSCKENQEPHRGRSQESWGLCISAAHLRTARLQRGALLSRVQVFSCAGDDPYQVKLPGWLGASIGLAHAEMQLVNVLLFL